MDRLVKALLLSLLMAPAAWPLAEKSVSYEVKNGTVVAVYDRQLVVRMANGQAREITIPKDFKFTIDGKQVGLEELKPGTELTAVITTTKMPQKVKTVEIKNGEVLKVVGDNVWFRHDGKIKSYNVPPGFNLYVDGRKVRPSELLPGYKITAEIVYTAEKTLTERDVEVSGRSPAPPR